MTRYCSGNSINMIQQQEDTMKDAKDVITTHIDSSHEKGNIFGKEREASGHPKVKEGCYANAEGKSEK